MTWIADFSGYWEDALGESCVIANNLSAASMQVFKELFYFSIISPRPPNAAQKKSSIIDAIFILKS